MKEKIENIIRRYNIITEDKPNEAMTRHNIIDEILHHVLGYSKEDYTIEKNVKNHSDFNNNYLDYKISMGMTSFLIEAKRVGNIQSGIPCDRKHKLDKKLFQGDVLEAFEQAKNYAISESVPFAVVTDGSVWIIFPTQRVDSVPITESHAVIFHNIEDVLINRQTEFLNILSRDSVISGSLDKEFLSTTSNQNKDRRLNIYHDTGFSRKNKQSSFFKLIENAVNISLTDEATKRQDFLRFCYIDTPDRTKFDNKIQMHVSKENNTFPSKPIKPMGNKGSKNINDILTSKEIRVKPMAILVIGDVGAGKSTFLQYTRHVTLENILKKREDSTYSHWIYIDFKDFSSGTNPELFIMERMRKYIEEDQFLNDYERCIKHAYKDEINAKKSGIWKIMIKDDNRINELIFKHQEDDYNKITPYVEKIISYATKNTNVYLVIDNIDQLSEDSQSLIFSDSMAISHRLKVNFICSIRRETYYKHRYSARIDAFDYDIIYIEPPKINALLSKRFNLASNILKDKEADIDTENGTKTRIDDLSKIIEMCRNSILGTEVEDFLRYTSEGDIRLCLRLTRNFLLSGYTDPMHGIHNNDTYILPKHEAIRGILLGGERVYNEEKAIIANIFDSRLSRNENQLLRLYTLSYFTQKSRHKDCKPILGNYILDNFKKIGFGTEITENILKDLIKSRLIKNISYVEDVINSNYIPTRLGTYVTSSLISEFMFIENMSMDTYIEDKDTWDSLQKISIEIEKENSTVPKIKLRTERSIIFYEYINKKYNDILLITKDRNMPIEWMNNPLSESKENFLKNIEKTINSAVRNKK